MIELRPFDKTDWWGYAGAEKFPSGEEPLIYWGELFTMIVDAKGISFTVGDIEYVFEEDHASAADNREESELLLEKISNLKTKEEVEAHLRFIGFETL